MFSYDGRKSVSPNDFCIIWDDSAVELWSAHHFFGGWTGVWIWICLFVFSLTLTSRCPTYLVYFVYFLRSGKRERMFTETKVGSYLPPWYANMFGLNSFACMLERYLHDQHDRQTLFLLHALWISIRNIECRFQWMILTLSSSHRVSCWSKIDDPATGEKPLITAGFELLLYQTSEEFLVVFMKL